MDSSLNSYFEAPMDVDCPNFGGIQLNRNILLQPATTVHCDEIDDLSTKFAAMSLEGSMDYLESVSSNKEQTLSDTST